MIVALALAAKLVWAAPSGVVTPTDLFFHALLERSAPAAGETLTVAPREVVLTFSGPIEESGASVRLLGPDGAAWSIGVRHPDGNARTLSGTFPSLIAAGYRVEWRIVSADGHAVRGDFTFTIEGDGAAAPAPPPPPSEGMEPAAGDVTGDQGARPLLVAARAGSNVTLLALAGLLVFVALGSGAPGESTRRTASALAVVAPALSSAHAWLWASQALRGTPGGGSALTALTDLTTGRSLGAEALLAWMVAWALLLARRPGLSAGFAVAAVSARGFGGHPAAYTPLLAVPASVLHQLAVAIWIGGLLYLVTERNTSGFAVSAQRVSAAALGAVVLIVATGLAQTGAFVDSPASLFTSTYGALILAKFTGLASLVALGAYHRFRLFPGSASPDGRARLARSVRFELALAAAVMVLAAVLSHTPPNP